jgi:hypothetical protein
VGGVNPRTPENLLCASKKFFNFAPKMARIDL